MELVQKTTDSVELPSVMQLKDVRKVYQMGKVETVALRGVNLKVYENDFLMIVGPSGSGKSTMLHIMGALDKPTSGQVYIDNVNLSLLNENELADLRLVKIGFVFQFFNLIPTLNALENVELPMALANAPKKLRRKRAMELLEEVGLADRWHHYPNELSGGEQQRVAIARALANNPVILLLDEPTGNVDSKTARRIMDLLAELNKSLKKTIVLITHNLMLTKYAKRVAHMLDGQITKVEVNEIR
ncbi:MAG: ABC transporter ATP-binding protein [Candidatus Asgardarchaeia archaeon]